MMSNKIASSRDDFDKLDLDSRALEAATSGKKEVRFFPLYIVTILKMEREHVC